jgi:hypothetical protein
MWFVAVSEQADDAADAVQAFSAYPFGVCEGGCGGRGVGGENAAGPSDVQHNNGEGVSDEVVHVSGDSVPLLPCGGVSKFGIGVPELAGKAIGVAKKHPDEDPEGAAESEVDRADIPFEADEYGKERDGHDYRRDRGD